MSSSGCFLVIYLKTHALLAEPHSRHNEHSKDKDAQRFAAACQSQRDSLLEYVCLSFKLKPVAVLYFSTKTAGVTVVVTYSTTFGSGGLTDENFLVCFGHS